jgi:hypothetical protein
MSMTEAKRVAHSRARGVGSQSAAGHRARWGRLEMSWARRAFSRTGTAHARIPSVTTDAPTPLPLRPSAAERERIARVLRERSVEERLSPDTFSERVERVYGARTRDELEELISDVQPARAPRRLVLRLVEWMSRLGADLAAAWERPRTPVIALPAASTVSLTIGRAKDCDCVLTDPTVSRHHAELRRDGERWLLRDLGSRNGTRVNGMRVLAPTEVHPGDRIALGDARYRLGTGRGGALPD